MKITNPGSEIARKMSNERHKDLDEIINRIKHKTLTRSSIVNDYFPTAITDELMTNSRDSKEQKKVPMKKIRFGDLKKDDVFWFAGKKMKKLEEQNLHAITITDRGKESFMFFKHNLVNVESVVDNNELDCFYAPNIPFGRNSIFLDGQPISEEPGTIFLDVQPVSEDYVKTLLKPYIVKTNSILSDDDRKSLAMIA